MTKLNELIHFRTSMRQVFTILIIVMWVASFIADLTNKAYDPPAYVNPLIMLVAGYFFATSGSNDKKSTGKKEDPDG